jgi:hypothetical protein
MENLREIRIVAYVVRAHGHSHTLALQEEFIGGL